MKIKDRINKFFMSRKCVIKQNLEHIKKIEHLQKRIYSLESKNRINEEFIDFTTEDKNININIIP
jgi:hypothetical protein